MNEFELISRLTRALPTNDAVVIGAGDDCAVLECGDATDVESVLKVMEDIKGPVYVRMLRGEIPRLFKDPMVFGRARVLSEGSDIVIVGFGPIVQRGLRVAERLRASGLSVGVVNAIWARPIDDALYRRLGRSCTLIVTLEESVAAGGFGGAVAESLAADQAATGVPIRATLLSIGIPAGAFVDHGSVADLRALIGLDESGIERQIRAAWGVLQGS